MPKDGVCLGKSHPQTRRRISALQQLPDGGAQKNLSMSVRILLCLHNEWRTQANQTPASSAFVRQPKRQKPPAGNWAYYLTSSHKPFGRSRQKTEQTDYTQAFARVCNRITPFKMLPEATENRQEQPRADKVRRFPPAEDFTRFCQSAIMRIVIPLHL